MYIDKLINMFIIIMFVFGHSVIYSINTDMHPGFLFGGLKIFLLSYTQINNFYTCVYVSPYHVLIELIMCRYLTSNIFMMILCYYI